MSDDATTAEACALWAELLPTRQVGWIPGMAAPDGWVVTAHGPNSGVVLTDDLAYSRPVKADDYPEFEHPGTLGGLTWMMRQAWGDPTMSVSFEKDGWKGRDPSGRWTPAGPSEALALLRAIEAAPGSS